MGTKIWNFFLPESGAHQFRVEKIGDVGQQVYIDGQLQKSTEARIFSGPANSLLEFRRCKDTQAWSFMVNGNCVEDYNPNRRANGDESLRQLRGRPDGSYIIAPRFEVPELEALIVRKFRFRAGHEQHEVQVAHSDCVWQVIVDGNLISRECHRMRDNNGHVSFEIEASPQVHLPAVLQMTWGGRESKWQYSLAVNSTEVPAYWTNGGLHTTNAEAVVVIAETPAPAPPPSPEEATTDSFKPMEELHHGSNVCLPQGVSVDTASGAYHANIRSASGKFVFLGAFRTAEEAHQKYLEAVPLHCPGKSLYPDFAA
mmetsp:Transcript_65017/g.101493  ORF Transcript_65017/g.101493 Transcript_65017/m.101493 type:complete len:313 (+) Transcript_65017:91-1029(+)